MGKKQRTREEGRGNGRKREGKVKGKRSAANHFCGCTKNDVSLQLSVEYFVIFFSGEKPFLNQEVLKYERIPVQVYP